MSSELPTHPRLDEEDRVNAGGDAEPLLGARGDVSAQQPPTKPLAYNLITGTALFAQGGILILAATVWAAIFMNKLMLFSVHPLLNSGALLFSVEAILLLQPTHTPQQKRAGAIAHGTFNGAAFLAFAGALVVILYNKETSAHPHFTSIHGILGLVTYIVLLVQTAVGFTMYALPGLYGGVSKAKNVWKFHRMSGYAVITLALATVCAATQTDFVAGVLGIELWVILVSSVLILVGLVPRIRPAKLGFTKK